MNISIESALSIHGQGTRDNNEDSLYPDFGKATSKDSLFIVCDGVGGMAYGELASKLTCTDLAAYFLQINPVAVSDEAYIEQAMGHVQHEFDAYLNDHSEAKGMATTLTLLHTHTNGATVAHIGDSRVYHVRQGKVIWHTEDHSLINEYIKHKIITPEEAELHPDRNKITRAIQGSDTKKAKADVKMIPLEDLQGGDYFLLCSDGVLEAISDQEIEMILANENSDEKKVETINELCLEKSSDNYTAYLVRLGFPSTSASVNELPTEQVGEVPVQNSAAQEAISEIEVNASNNPQLASKNDVVGTDPTEEPIVEEKKIDQYIRESKSDNRLIVAVFSFLVVLALVYYFLDN